MTFDCSQLIGDKCKRLKKACVIGQRGCILQNRNFKDQLTPKEIQKSTYSLSAEGLTKILK